MSVSIRVLAYTFPAICIVMGVILLITGQEMSSPELKTWGGNLIIIGAVLQVLYLILKYGKEYLE
jgi:hypothetical protein